MFDASMFALLLLLGRIVKLKHGRVGNPDCANEILIYGLSSVLAQIETTETEAGSKYAVPELSRGNQRNREFKHRRDRDANGSRASSIFLPGACSRFFISSVYLEMLKRGFFQLIDGGQSGAKTVTLHFR